MKIRYLLHKLGLGKRHSKQRMLHKQKHTDVKYKEILGQLSIKAVGRGRKRGEKGYKRCNWKDTMKECVLGGLLKRLSSTTTLLYPWTPLVAQIVKCLPTMWETRVQSLGWEDLLEKEMTTHSSILAWKIPWRGIWLVIVHGATQSQR